MVRNVGIKLIIVLVIISLALVGCNKTNSNQKEENVTQIENEEHNKEIDNNKYNNDIHEFIIDDAKGKVDIQLIDLYNYKEITKSIGVEVNKAKFDGKHLVIYAKIVNNYSEDVKLYHDIRQIITVENKGKLYKYEVPSDSIMEGRKNTIPKNGENNISITFITADGTDIDFNKEIKMKLTLDFNVKEHEFKDTSTKIEITLNEEKEEIVFVPIDKDIEFHENAGENIKKYDENGDGLIDKFEYEKYLTENPDDLNGDMFRELSETVISMLENTYVVIDYQLEQIFEDKNEEEIQQLFNIHPLYKKYYEIKIYMDKNKLTTLEFEEWDKINNKSTSNMSNNNKGNTKPADKPTPPATNNNGMTQKEIDDAKKMSDDFMKDALNWDSGTGGNGSLEEYQKPFDPVN